MSMEAGATLGGWILVEKVGSSPWTETWRARDAKDDTKTALLEVATHVGVAKELVATPPRPAPDHAHLAKTLASELTGDRPFIASESPEGESLRAVIEREKTLPSRSGIL